LIPKIIEQPESLSKHCGEEATLTIVAQGPGKIRYQWQKDGKKIINRKLYEGVTNHTLAMNPLQPRHAGQYSCIVENEHGTTVSKEVDLTLNIRLLSKISHV
jgi:hypothetical protein